MTSVAITKIMSIIDKGEWFHKWLMKQGQKSKDICKEAQQRGTSLHKLIEDWHKGIRQEDEDQKLKMYVQWYRMKGLVHLGSEINIEHTEDGYHGRLDNLYKDQEGNLIIGDIKSGKGIYEEARIQVDAYMYAYMHMHNKPIKKGVIVRVGDNGIIEDWFKPSEQRHKILLCARELYLHFLEARK